MVWRLLNEQDGTAVLNGAIATTPATGTQETWTVDALPAALQTASYAMRADSLSTEIVHVVAINSATSIEVKRAMEGTSATTHADNTVFYPQPTAATLDLWLDDNGIPVDGWIAAGETWTYASADDPTFTFTITGDLTAKYQAGHRIKLTQTTAKYFLITKVAHAAGTTTITVYGGTDYDLANAAITSPYYSPVKAPFGFPMDPAKWTAILTDTADRAQASPVANTVYNLGTLSLSIPIGVWDVSFQILLDHNRPSGGPLLGKCGLSTANNSFSDNALVAGSWAVDSGTPRAIAQSNRQKVLTLAAKTTYYLVASVNANGTSLDFRGDLVTTVASARSAYL